MEDNSCFTKYGAYITMVNLARKLGISRSGLYSLLRSRSERYDDTNDASVRFGRLTSFRRRKSMRSSANAMEVEMHNAAFDQMLDGSEPVVHMSNSAMSGSYEPTERWQR